MRKTILFSISLFLLITSSLAQGLRHFSEDPEIFITEIPVLFDGLRNQEDIQQAYFVIDSLRAEWERNKITEDEKWALRQVSEILLDRRLKSWPEFFNFFYLVLQFHARDDQLIPWLESIKVYAENNSLRRIENYLQQYLEFFDGKFLAGTSTLHWVYTDSIFLFRFDTVPRFHFKNTSLICSSPNDTTTIHGTAGIFFPLTAEWKGKGGEIYWDRFGIPRDSIHAELTDYTIDLNNSSYEADSAIFYYRRFFDFPIIGEFSEKIFSSRPNRNTPYPQFNSYLKTFEIRELFPGVSYNGGITVEGLRFIGSGDREENASVTFKTSPDQNLVLRSNAFIITTEEINANPASVALYLDEDSIFHAGLQMKYDHGQKQLILARGRKGISASPFFNSFHQVDMFVEAMYWNIDSSSIDFKPAIGLTRTSNAEFVSTDYYSEYEFDKLQGIDLMNPLYILRKLSEDYKTREVSSDLLANYMKKPREQAEALLIKLSNKGLVYYDLGRDEAILEDRLFDYIDANLGRIDYDVIRIFSHTEGESNATLDINTRDLLIRGVSEVFLSDSQKVYIYPRQNEIILKRNRDFVFTGRVRAGLFDFYARDCSFEYDTFRLNLPTVDSLSIRVNKFKDDMDEPEQIVSLINNIEDLSGTLLIDRPYNKSGLRSFPEYPLFKSENESFVYYDQQSLYDRQSFKYHVEPFSLESLDQFSTDGLEFEGFLESDSIFPDIRQPLKVQPDYSLGFNKDLPAEGVDVYGGKGRFFNNIDLSDKGLRGEGRLEFLTSTTEADNFQFYADSMLALSADTFLIEPLRNGPEYPLVQGDSVFQQWYPASDSMLVTSLDQPFSIYEKEASFKGKLIYTHHGLSAAGIVNYENAEMVSADFDFDHHIITADTLDFRLFRENTDSLVLDARNYATMLDFEQRNITFRSNLEVSAIAFPYNEMLCFMTDINWNMDGNELSLTESDMADINVASLSENERLDQTWDPTFRSTNPQMDSLQFFAGKARYDIDNYIVYAEEVPFVKIADAAIFPYNGSLKVLKGGKIDSLSYASIIAPVSSKDHLLTNATVDIFSGSYYEGAGAYQYEDYSGLVEEIHMGEVWVSPDMHTMGKGFVNDSENFLLSPQFAFKGDVEMDASSPYLNFKGGYKVKDGCLDAKNSSWVAFESRVNPQVINLPVPVDPVDIEGGTIESGIFYSAVLDEIYPALFRKRKILTDTAIFSASGRVTYDSLTRRFIVAPRRRLENDLTGDNIMVIDNRRCSVTGSGKLDLPVDYGNYVKVKGFGDVEYLIVPDSTTFETALFIDFIFFDAALKMMVDSIAASNLTGLDLMGNKYNKTLSYILDPESRNEMQSDIGLMGNIRKIPEALMHTFFLTDVNLYWNSETKSLMSRGKLGISVVGEDQVNRYVEGFVEFVKKRSGDELNLYIEAGEKNWYFFNFRGNIMQAISSDMEFNNRLSDLKSDKRIFKVEDEPDPYEFVLSSRRKRIDFLRKMEEYNR